jgi:hypothetical protein
MLPVTGIDGAVSAVELVEAIPHSLS